tara:strand:+ start:23 stop:685 length:663 start_codon:yes stop_codon:yes gene_type:complete
MTKKTNATTTAKINAQDADNRAQMAHITALATALGKMEARTETAIQKVEVTLTKATKSAPAYAAGVGRMVELGGIILKNDSECAGSRKAQGACKEAVAKGFGITVKKVGPIMSQLRAIAKNATLVAELLENDTLKPRHATVYSVASITRQNMPKADKPAKAKGTRKTVSKGTHNVSATIRGTLRDAKTVKELVLALRAECQAAGVDQALVDAALIDHTTA